MLLRLLAPFLLLALIAAGCGSDDSTETADTAAATTEASDDSGADENTTEAPTTEAPTTTEVENFSGDDNSEFCRKAREFDENDPLESSSLLAGESFFDDAEAAFGEVIPIAPDDIKGDFETSLEGLRQMGEILATYDYDFFDDGLNAEMEALDTTEMDAAGERIAAYLEDVCGIENALEADPDDVGGILDGIDPTDLEDLDIDSDAAQALLEQFGIDEELAACLNEELGAEFDFESPDPSFLTQEVCGTTILEIVSGFGAG